MSTIPTHGPEERWRRTVDQRGRPLKLKVGRLLKEFGYAALDPGVGEAIEASLGRAGLHVRPSLRDATADQVITLELVNPAAGSSSAAAATPAAADPPAPAAEPAFGVEAELPFQRTAEPYERAPERPAERTSELASRRPAAPAYQPPEYAQTPAGRSDERGADDMEQSLLVRAAVEAERRVRSAYDRTAAASAERIAGLERELAAEREATAQARDERDELERRMHVERREAAARMQALASAERTARGLLEAQRTELSNLAQTVRVSTTAIAQTRETLGEVHAQVQQTSVEVRDALTDSAVLDAEAEIAAAELEHAAMIEAGMPLGELEAAPAEQPAAIEGEAAEREPEAALEPAPGTDTPALPSWAQDAAPERPPARRGRRAERLRRRAAIVCAVCGRASKTKDPAELTAAGWAVEGDAALCVSCLQDDWKLAEGDSVPFRSHG